MLVRFGLHNTYERAANILTLQKSFARIFPSFCYELLQIGDAHVGRRLNGRRMNEIQVVLVD